MSLPLQSEIKINIKRKYPYLLLAFFILMCILGFGLLYFYTVVYGIHIESIVIASDKIPD